MVFPTHYALGGGVSAAGELYENDSRPGRSHGTFPFCRPSEANHKAFLP